MLEQIIRRDVLPTLRRRHLPGQAGMPNPAQAAAAERVVQVLLAPSYSIPEEIERIVAIARPFGWTAVACADLFQASARLLGDRLTADSCSELDVTLALGTLQAALYTMHDVPATGLAGQGKPPSVLVAPLPGETHHLGAALDREVLWLIGLAVDCEHPNGTGELEQMLAGQWFDVLDLGLSCVIRREHWLPRLTQTIAQARAASCNPQLAVMVAGRLFSEDAEAWQAVGADAGAVSAADLRSTVDAALRHAGASKPAA